VIDLVAIALSVPLLAYGTRLHRSSGATTLTAERAAA
jgi:hypothetical protein